MNYHEFMKIAIVLSCIGSNVLAGLQTGNSGNGGYQYKPASGFNDRAGLSFGNLGGGGFRTRPTQLYGAPGLGGTGGSSPFEGAPSTSYGTPSTSYGTPSAASYEAPSTTYGAPSGAYGAPGFTSLGNGYGTTGDYGRPKPYSFQYKVYDPPSGNDYSQQENSNGNLVQGEYRVLLPDSRTQIVKYTADDVNGYNANVQYEGEAQFPQDIRYGAPTLGNNVYGSGNTGSNQYLPPHGIYSK